MGRSNAKLAPPEEADRFFNAIKKNDVKTIRKVAAAYPRMLEWETGDGTLLHYVVTVSSNVEMVKCFLDLGFDVDGTRGAGTPLWHAVPYGSDKVIEYLIKRGANVNAGRGEWSTVLHGAVNANRPKIVKLLLEHGADPRFEDEEGETPLALAMRRKFPTVIKLLRKFDAPIDGKPVKKRLPKDATIDLAASAPQIEKFVEEAIRRFAKMHSHEPVTAVGLYGSGVHGFVSVCFETREFTGDVPGMKFARFAELEFPKWAESYDYAERIELKGHNGRAIHIGRSRANAVFQKPFFDLFIHVLKKLQRAKGFHRLNRVPKFQIGVEIMDGTHAKFWKVK